MLTIKLAMNEIIQTTKLKIRHILEFGHEKKKIKENYRMK